jgi:hypothetical protein
MGMPEVWRRSHRSCAGWQGYDGPISVSQGRPREDGGAGAMSQLREAGGTGTNRIRLVFRVRRHRVEPQAEQNREPGVLL